MLGRLIKYELMATARIFGLLYAGLLLVAVINALLLPVDMGGNSGSASATSAILNGQGFMDSIYGILLSISICAYVVLVLVVLVMTVVISVMRFYKLLGDEGYLWMTLPVTPVAHIMGKLICSFIWFVGSMIVVALSVGILLIKTGWIVDIPEIVGIILDSGLNFWLWVPMCIATLATSWLSGILQFYAAIAIGPNIMKSRLGGSVIAYILMYIVGQIVATIFMVIGMLLLSGRVEVLDNTLNSMATGAGYELFVETVDFAGLVIVGGSCLIYLVIAVVFFLLARYYMDRKLNLA
jgi:hypothetical protein